jgi:Flp pilus assembly protein CpaB
MKSGSKLFIFTGVALALVTVLLAITMTSGGNKADAQKEDTPSKIKVVQAAADFEPHKVIAMSDILIVEMAADEVPAEAATDTALVLGQSYKLGAVKGDILLNTYLEAPGITAQIAPGKRAFSLEVDNREMMAGLIMDGDYVDIVFDARVDLRRVLEVQGIDFEEDGPYTVTSLSGNDNGDESQSSSDSESQDNNSDEDGGIVPGIETAPYQGKAGSEFTVADWGGKLEPVTKILVQDVKVIRVVKPGTTYDAQGQQVDNGAESVAANDAKSGGQLILEVTPQQAEALSFMQQQPEDQYQYHDVEVIIRGVDDHEIATTTGITFQVLMSDGTWSMPWPKPIDVPEAKDAKE